MRVDRLLIDQLQLNIGETNSDYVLMSQYETGSRTPKEALVQSLSDVLDVSPLALKVPDIDSYLGLIHTLFAMEDMYGITAEQHDGKVHIVFDSSEQKTSFALFSMLSEWATKAEMLRNGEISKEEYDQWRYTFPTEDTTQRWASVPSQELSDLFVDAFK